MAGRMDRWERYGRSGQANIDKLGGVLVNGFHQLALFAIGATIVWSAIVAFSGMALKGHASVEDILLLFIYLELGAMVGIYFTTNHMPVRFLIYVALTALTRLLIGMANVEHIDIQAAISTPHWGLIIVTFGVLMLSVSVLILRFASYRYPSYRGSGIPAAGREEDLT
ncbi:MAG: phosphate-starvation-inducible PsiE family protein [Fimbriimonadaceae bacterium]|nr:phosphate-starvation-inducible PsiE family protein [Alphaproteobacteria bacterium]